MYWYAKIYQYLFINYKSNYFQLYIYSMKAESCGAVCISAWFNYNGPLYQYYTSIIPVLYQYFTSSNSLSLQWASHILFIVREGVKKTHKFYEHDRKRGGGQPRVGYRLKNLETTSLRLLFRPKTWEDILQSFFLNRRRKTTVFIFFLKKIRPVDENIVNVFLRVSALFECLNVVKFNVLLLTIFKKKNISKKNFFFLAVK